MAGVEVRAATDKMGGGMVPNEPLFLREARGNNHGRGIENPLFSRVRDALLWHGAPAAIRLTAWPLRALAAPASSTPTLKMRLPKASHALSLAIPFFRASIATSSSLARRGMAARRRLQN